MIPAEAVEAAAIALEKADGWMYDRIMYQRMAKIALEAAAPHMLAPILALMADPEHYDSQGPSNGYVSVDNLRAAMEATK